MSSIVRTLKKGAKIVLILAVVAAIGYAAWMWQTNDPVEVKSQQAQDTSEYQERVEQKMLDTATEWEQKHRVWAEQEVSREIIAEQERKLEALREQELSL